MKKIYTKKWIMLAAIFGGIASNYMLYKNYKLFKNKHPLRNAILILILIIVFSVVIDFLRSKIFPYYGYLDYIFTPIIELLIFYKFVTHFQEDDIEEYIKKGTKKESIFNNIIIIISGLLLSIGIVALFVFTIKAIIWPMLS